MIYAINSSIKPKMTVTDINSPQFSPKTRYCLASFSPSRQCSLIYGSGERSNSNNASHYSQGEIRLNASQPSIYRKRKDLLAQALAPVWVEAHTSPATTRLLHTASAFRGHQTPRVCQRVGNPNIANALTSLTSNRALPVMPHVPDNSFH